MEYRIVDGCPFYRVGKDGTIWSRLKRGPNKTYLFGPWKLLKPGKGRYLHVRLTKNGAKHVRLVHHVVLEAFVGPCPAGMECRHLNGVGTDCRLSNLKWGTPQENYEDRIKHGTGNEGENTSGHKLGADDVVEVVGLLKEGRMPQDKIAEKFGVTQGAIAHIKNGRTWNHVTGYRKVRTHKKAVEAI